MRRSVSLLAVMICATAVACAQSEAGLREYFEGKTVVARLDLPASKTGVDIYPETTPPLNFPEYGRRLKQFGIAIRRNEPVTITKVRVNPKSIEFQLGEADLGGGGDGASPDVYVAADKSPRERKLERDVETETDSDRKEKMQRELDDLRQQRSREDARLRAALAQMSALRQESERQRASNGGSRFNLMFPNGVPARALNPDYVISALKQWVDFDEERSQPATSVEPVRAAGLRKGMSESELQRIFGDPIKREPSTMGDLHVEVLTFRKDGSTLEATLVEGVLVRFNQWSD